MAIKTFLLLGARWMASKTKGKIIIRSTILPNLLVTLQFDFYVPEFLHEIRAVEIMS